VYAGWNVPLEYDPLLAKLCAWGPTRERAVQRLERALAEYELTGVRHNLNLFREICRDPFFREGRLSTAFLDQFFERRQPEHADLNTEAAAALVLAMTGGSREPAATKSSSGWLAAGREDLLR
jgi:acetyl-CoA carboxylase biotin carboxylase subunit